MANSLEFAKFANVFPRQSFALYGNAFQRIFPGSFASSFSRNVPWSHSRINVLMLCSLYNKPWIGCASMDFLYYKACVQTSEESLSFQNHKFAFMIVGKENRLCNLHIHIHSNSIILIYTLNVGCMEPGLQQPMKKCW